jgi:hypothetical protein
MDKVNEGTWNLIQEHADKRGIWVNMRRLWDSLSDWSLDYDQIFQEFREIESYGLIVMLPADSEDDGCQLLIRRKKWNCFNCSKMVEEVPTEHMDECLRRQRKMAGWRARFGD